jgi:hypothetical protein
MHHYYQMVMLTQMVTTVLMTLMISLQTNRLTIHHPLTPPGNIPFHAPSSAHIHSLID